MASKQSSSEPQSAVADTSLSEAVIHSVAGVCDTDPVDLPPLYEAIDPDALDTLFEHRPVEWAVEFAYNGYRVTVAGDGTIEIQ